MRVTLLLRLAVLAGLVGLLAAAGGDALLLFAPLLLLAAPLSLDRYPGVDVLVRLARRADDRPPASVVVVLPMRRVRSVVAVAARVHAGTVTHRGPPACAALAA